MANNQKDEEPEKKTPVFHTYSKMEIVFISIISIFLFIAAVFAF